MFNPVNYKDIKAPSTCTYFPSTVKPFNNAAYCYWMRSLMQRALSVIEVEGLPDEWKNEVEEFLWFCLFKYGYVAVFYTDKLGTVFNPASLRGYDFYYQYTNAVIANPSLDESLDLKIGEKCAILRIAPDFMGIWDTLSRFAEQLAAIDSSINMSIVNSKFAWLLAARNKGMQSALKKMLDKIYRGEPAVIVDQRVLNDTTDKDVPYQFLERSNLKQSYITTDQLMDEQTILSMFDSEIGINSLPYANKKERLVSNEVDAKDTDSKARVNVWIKNLNESAEVVNKMFGLNLKFKIREEEQKDVIDKPSEPVLL